MKTNFGIGLCIFTFVVTVLPVTGYAQALKVQVTYEQVYTLDFGVPGEVSEIFVTVGDSVGKDMLLAQLSDSYYSAALEAARQSLVLAELENIEQADSFERSTVLFDEGSLSAVELNLARIALAKSDAALAAAQASLSGAQSRLRLSKVYSPEAGTVIGVSRRIGERVNPDRTSDSGIVLGAGELILAMGVEDARDSGLLPGSRIGVSSAGGEVSQTAVKKLDWYSRPGAVLIWVSNSDQLPVSGTWLEFDLLDSR